MADPKEVRRARRLAAEMRQAGVQHVVFCGAAGRRSGLCSRQVRRHAQPSTPTRAAAWDACIKAWPDPAELTWKLRMLLIVAACPPTIQAAPGCLFAEWQKKVVFCSRAPYTVC